MEPMYLLTNTPTQVGGNILDAITAATVETVNVNKLEYIYNKLCELPKSLNVWFPLV